MLSIKKKLNLFGILIILLTLVLTTISIAWVLTENYITQSKIELQENIKMIQTELKFNKKRLLDSSQKIAELQELDLKIKHITRNKDHYNQTIKPLYAQLANATHDSAKIAGSIWKTMIYDKQGDLISFSHIEKNYSKKGYAFNFPNVNFMIADGKTSTNPLYNPWNRYTKYYGFNPHFKGEFPKKETIIYSKDDSKLTVKSYYPIMGLNFNKKLRKMTPSHVGFVLSENPLDHQFIDKIKNFITKKEINIYMVNNNNIQLSVGTLKQYKSLSKTYEKEQKVKIDGINYIQDTLPLYNGEELIGVIALLQIEKTIGDYILQLLESLVLVFIIILFIVIPFTMLLIRTITNPIINLQKGIKELSSGNLGKQLEVYSKDEIGELTMSFNDMSKELAKTDKIKILNTKLKKTYHQLKLTKEEIEQLNSSLELKIEKEIDKNTKQQVIIMQQSKLAQMGEMIENIAHQWRQPLAQINSSVLLLDVLLERNNKKDDMVEEKLLEIESLTAYMSKTINDFKNFFNPNKSKTNFTIEEAINRSCEILKGSLKIHNIKVNNNVPKDLQCYSYVEELQQVLLTIFNNAIDVLVSNKIENGVISINSFQKDKDIIITIQDNGLGIDKKHIDKIFDPYFTTKHKSQGTGLGLYMAKMIIENGLKGVLEVENKNGGACFIIQIPQGKI